METIELLGVALGLGALAGINLYLTVFATGLAIHMKWVLLSPQYESLSILGEPVILILAGILYFTEFFADKVPWLDSAWDTVHTAIRPIGGALLAVTALGETNAVFDVVIALIGGGAALTTHAAKAGTRLLVNTSPEPFSNIAISVVEDVGVLGGLALLNLHPALSLLVFGLLILGLLIFVPKIFRAIATMLGLAWKKLSAAGAGKKMELAELQLPPRFDEVLERQLAPMPVRVAWAAPVIVRRVKGLEVNREGWLVALEGMEPNLHVVARARGGIRMVVLPLEGHKVALEKRMLAGELTIYSGVRNSRAVFLFDRSRDLLAEQVCKAVEARLPLAETTAQELPDAGLAQAVPG